jgi:hypothetical protein
MRTTWIKLTATGCVMAAVAWTPVARAQGNKVSAEALFEEGRKLIAQRNPAQACPKFAESQRLDPSPSTLLNLASCYERLGKTASAWATYREAASSANALSRETLMAVASRHAAAIEPDLARLVITASVPVEGLEIRREGQVVGRGEWDVAMPVDPGPITVEASAPKKKRWSASIEVTQPGKTVTLSVPALEDGPPEPPPTTTTSAEMSGPAAPYDSGALVPHRATWQKPAALVSGGVGVAGLVVGTVFVLSAKSKYDDSLAKCPSSKDLCTPEGVSLRNDARSAGTTATVAYAAGGVALVAGAVLWFTAPKSEKSRTSAELHLSPSLGGVTMYGQW